MRMRLFMPGRIFGLFCASVLCGAWGSVVISQSQSTIPDLQKRLELLAQSMTLIRDRHVLKPDVASLLDGAIRGMLEKADPDAHYYNREELERLRSAQSDPAQFAGIGVAIRKDPGQRRGQAGGLHVVAALNGGAAAKAGIKSGDLITHVDDEAMLGQPISNAEARLIGPAGSKVALRIVRRASDAPFDVLLTRAAITAPVAITQIAGGVLLVSVTDISSSIDRDLRAVLAPMTSPGKPIAGMILDLRNAAGGTLQSAVSLADALLDNGAIATEQSRRTAAPVPVAVARPGDIADRAPLVVLINGGSAMAAEIVAAALRDNKRATIVGTRSAGRTGERQLIELGKPSGQAGAILLTTKRYMTPAGTVIDGKGLVPDVVVEQAAASGECRDTDIQSPEGICLPRLIARDTQLVWAQVLVTGRFADLAAP